MIKKVLLLNPILFTNEGYIIKRESVDDTLLITLCKAFVKIGIAPTLITDISYQPTYEVEYPFEIIYLDSRLKKVFSPTKFPFPKGLHRYLSTHGKEYDLIISSEVFSLYSLISVTACRSKTVIWHEMAKQNRMMHGMASKIWYNLIGRTAFRNVPIAPRTRRAKEFISNYCKNVSKNIFDHGVDTEKFVYEAGPKKDILISVSQLVARKQVNRLIEEFAKFSHENSTYKLYVCGDGDEMDNLKELTVNLGIESKVVFTGKLSHEELMKVWPYSKAILIYTAKDNSIMTIPESIVCETPVITTTVPDCSYFVEDNSLGIVKDEWTSEDIESVVKDNDKFVNNCKFFKNSLSSIAIAERFVKEYDT